jgi:pyruvyltransferase
MTDLPYKIFRILRNAFIELFDNPIVINACTSFKRYGEIIPSNWGDDLNYFFIKEIVKQKWLPYAEAPITRYFHKKNYVIIGSIIDMVMTPKSIVWGAGLITANPRNIVRPLKIHAVRGPKTREILLKNGINCPAIYGDPALLLPFYYQPKDKSKKFKLGFIPHYSHINQFLTLYSHNPNICVIKVRNYYEWHSFIDKICQCEYIASTSLHGLIISEAYGIPNVWLKMESGELSNTFKFEDFYASINKTPDGLIFNSFLTLDEIINTCKKWKKGMLDLTPLIKACPFKLKNELLNLRI